MEWNENENSTYQNSWDTAKAMLGGKVTIDYTHNRKEEKSQINNLGFRLQKKKEEEKNKHKASRK